MTILVRLLNTAMFLAAWVGAFIGLHLLALQLLETHSFPPGQDLPRGFDVVVEKLANGAPASWETRPFHNQAQFKLDPGESLQLSARAYDQADHEITGSCCFAFKVLEDGPNGQLIELDNDDMTYVKTRYRVRDGKVTPLSFRSHFTLYYVAYLVLGGVLAWLLTRPLRRRTLAWARARADHQPSV